MTRFKTCGPFFSLKDELPNPLAFQLQEQAGLGHLVRTVKDVPSGPWTRQKVRAAVVWELIPRGVRLSFFALFCFFTLP